MECGFLACALPIESYSKGIFHSLAGVFSGFDHGVGHPLLLLYDAKAPNCQKRKEFKGLGHYPSNTVLSSFYTMIKL